MYLAKILCQLQEMDNEEYLIGLSRVQGWEENYEVFVPVSSIDLLRDEMWNWKKHINRYSSLCSYKIEKVHVDI